MITKKLPLLVVTTILAVGFPVDMTLAQSQNEAGANKSSTRPLKSEQSVKVSRQMVMNAQHVLKGRGYYAGEIDGMLGSQTRDALQRYQHDHGLNPDGYLTRETAEHLDIVGAATRLDSKGSPGEHFEQAGHAIGGGAKEFGKDVSKGKVGAAGKDLGKGVGGFAKGVGKGTAKATKRFLSKVADVFEGDDKSASKTQTDQVKVPRSTIINAQHVLKGQGYYRGDVDGRLGPESRKALERFQQNHGLTVDGRLTRATAEKLGIVVSSESTSPNSR